MHTTVAPLRVIIIYKSVKAGLQLSVALVLAVWLPLGLPSALNDVSGWLHHHVTHGWAARLAEMVATRSSSHNIVLLIVALGLDGTLTSLEAWSLRMGRWWGPWLVVVVTTALVPFEVYELWRVPRVSRLILLAVNVLISAYLARRAWHERARTSR